MSERTNVPALDGPRLPYHPKLQERFGIDKATWGVLVDAIFPAAKTVEAVIQAIAYCQARRLDILKRVVHIVPVWSSDKGRMVETIWPGIAELRTTAIRTGSYAGRAPTEYGPDITMTWSCGPGKGDVTVTFPEWCQVTVYRLVQGHRVPFPGPRVYWLETYAKMSRKVDAPNSMWATRPRGQLEKCAEAAALRPAFPEELGDEWSAEEARLIQDVHDVNHQRQAAQDPKQEPRVAELPPKALDDLADKLQRGWGNTELGQVEEFSAGEGQQGTHGPEEQAVPVGVETHRREDAPSSESFFADEDDPDLTEPDPGR